MGMQKDTGLEIKGDNDDDVFYAELKRQILLLMAEDEEDRGRGLPEVKSSSSERGAGGGPGSGCPVALLPGSCFQWLENEETKAAPPWLANLWRTGSGTGVFIPHIVKSSKRQKPRRSNSEQGRIYRPVANKSQWLKRESPSYS